MRRTYLFLILFFLVSSSSQSQEIRVLSWNVESGSPSRNDPAGGNDPAEIARQLSELGAYDLIGLTEVHSSNFERYTVATRGDSGVDHSIPTVTGGGDRMLIIFNGDRFELLSSIELHEHEGIALNVRNRRGRFRFRSPLVARFRDQQTNSEFFFMVNHLARGDEQVRREQARGLREWARDQTIPIIAAGDYNFDFNFSQGRGNGAFAIFLQDSVWRWIRPTESIDTNWADTNPRLPNAERTDRFPDTILDFVFVAGPANRWHATSEVIVRSGDFPDSGQTSDHRPVQAIFTLGSMTELLQRIETIRRELARMEALIKSMN